MRTFLNSPASYPSMSEWGRIVASPTTLRQIATDCDRLQQIATDCNRLQQSRALDCWRDPFFFNNHRLATNRAVTIEPLDWKAKAPPPAIWLRLRSRLQPRPRPQERYVTRIHSVTGTVRHSRWQRGQRHPRVRDSYPSRFTLYLWRGLCVCEWGVA